MIAALAALRGGKNGDHAETEDTMTMLTAFALGCALIVLAGLYSGGEI